MTLTQLLDKKHIILDVETFGLSGGVFSVGAVFGRFDVASDGQHVAWMERRTLAATYRWAARPWSFVPYNTDRSAGTVRAASGGVLLSGLGARDTFAWLQANIPASVFDPNRMTNALSIHAMFDSFAASRLTDDSTEWWAECPVPCEARFLHDMAALLGPPWGTAKIPPMRDVASLADPLGVTDERPDWALPAHDPLTDARWSAERLRVAVERLVRLRGGTAWADL